MLSKPKDGWSELTVGNFKAEVGYITNVPFELINAFNSFFEYGSGAVSFDCEPYSFDLIFSYTIGDTIGIAYIVDYGKNLFCDNIRILELAKSFVDDIKNNIDDWANWQYWLHDGGVENNKKLLEDEIKKLKNRIEKYEKERLK